MAQKTGQVVAYSDINDERQDYTISVVNGEITEMRRPGDPDRYHVVFALKIITPASLAGLYIQALGTDYPAAMRFGHKVDHYHNLVDGQSGVIDFASGMIVYDDPNVGSVSITYLAPAN